MSKREGSAESAPQGAGALASAAALALLLGGCATGPGTTADLAQDRPMGLEAAVTAPLDDLNLRRVEIPDVLRSAMAHPYDVRGLVACHAVAHEVTRLDEALGPDLDLATDEDGRPLSEQGAEAATEAALDAVRGAATDLIPFRSWVRLLSGAQRHDERVQAAILAGRTRRGFLKGIGMRMNCAPPAAPHWFRPAAAPAPSTGS